MEANTHIQVEQVAEDGGGKQSLTIPSHAVLSGDLLRKVLSVEEADHNYFPLSLVAKEWHSIRAGGVGGGTVTEEAQCAALEGSTEAENPRLAAGSKTTSVRLICVPGNLRGWAQHNGCSLTSICTASAGRGDSDFLRAHAGSVSVDESVCWTAALGEHMDVLRVICIKNELPGSLVLSCPGWKLLQDASVREALVDRSDDQQGGRTVLLSALRADAVMTAPGASRAVVAAMERHPADAEIQQEAMKCIALAISSQTQGLNTVAQAALVTAGAPDVVVAGLCAHPGDADVQSNGLGAAAYLAQGCAAAQAALVAAGAPVVVEAGLRTHQGNVRVQRNGLQAVSNLAQDCAAARAALLTAGVLDAVELARWAHPRDRDIQRAGLYAFANLARGLAPGLAAVITASVPGLMEAGMSHWMS
ncbi:hypothetical protein JKP88DRAFT_245017 [Tribonema minus]|uniref:Uncharacterized protein n=1 Tax=Tribonema minus TaxID=303371 RepID=A0A835YZA7_9STRA|nr:hypothetical protein JKP88DRAFT_245017 [Tribonema minus]